MTTEPERNETGGDRPARQRSARESERTARRRTSTTSSSSRSSDTRATERTGSRGRPARPAGDASTGEATTEARPERRRPSLTAGKAARLAMRQVSELTNRTPESVTSLERTDEGWRVGVEVVESHRIPDSTDILAVYEAELDGDGELVAYRRTQRYYRGRAQED